MWLRFFLISVLLSVPFLSFAILRNRKETAFMPVFFGKYKRYAPWIEAQAKHETGNFQSALFKKYHNAFGMKVPTKRDTVNVGSTPLGEFRTGPYLAYKNLSQSVRDYIKWLDYHKTPTNIETPRSYFEYLQDKGYAEDSSYIDKVMKWL